VIGVDPTYRADFIHPNDLGYQKLAGEAYRLLLVHYAATRDFAALSV